MAIKKQAANNTAKKRGRPTVFTPAILRQVRFLTERGATDAELADFFDVGITTIHNWKLKHPDFVDALKDGKSLADSNVVRSLYTRAIGYTHPDVHVSNFKGTITVTPLTKHHPPDTTACIFWLKNRNPDEWREKTEVTQINRVAPMTSDQIAEEMKGSPVFTKEIEELMANIKNL